MSTEFHLIEYQMLRGELLQIRKSRDDNLKLAIGANFAIISWVTASDVSLATDKLTNLLYILPIIVTTFSFFSWVNRNNLIKKIAHYLADLELRFAYDELGWERNLGGTESKLPFSASSFAYTAYGLMLIISFLVGFYRLLQ